MLRNFFITALRNLLRHRTFTLLNIGGLVLGLGCSIVLFSYIKFETSFNEEYESFDRIYRITLDVQSENYVGKTQQIPHPLVKALKAELGGIEHIAQFFNHGEAQITVTDGSAKNHFLEDDIAFTDAGLFKILDFDWLAGDGNIDDPRSVVISRSLAQKYFGVTENFRSLIGETITIDNTHDLSIKGVFEDVSKQSDFQFTMFIDYESQNGVNDYFGEGKLWGRLNGRTNGFLLMPEGADPILLSQQANLIYEKHRSMEQTRLYLQPLSDVHYNSEIGGINARIFPKQATWTLAIIAILLIVASSINFINLSTAKATNRAKEVGIRKVLGSNRGQLIQQHIAETFIIVMVSMLGALAFSELLFKLLAPIIGQSLSLVQMPADWLVSLLVGLVFAITLLAGLYPAFVVSSFTPDQALRASFGGVKRKGGMSLRRILVVAQFVISQALLLGTLVAIQQSEFLRGSDLGFHQEGIISIELPEVDQQKTTLLKNEFLSYPEVASVSAHLGSPMARTNNTGSVIYRSEDDQEFTFRMNFKNVDESYLELFGIELIAGENITSNDPKENVLVNMESLKKMGIQDPYEAIGKHMVMANYEEMRYVIKGVVSNFNSATLKESVAPVLFNYRENYFYELAIRLQNTSQESISGTLKKMDDTWASVYPEYVLSYDFVDEAIAEAYQAETRMVSLFRFFALLSIVIGCLGLYGLIDFIAIKKTKEIGIRKVLGATILNILRIFGKELLILLVISTLIACPLMYLVLQRWLEDYAYHIDLGIGTFVLSFLLICLISLLTMGYRSIKASNLNPVLTLKDE